MAVERKLTIKDGFSAVLKNYISKLETALAREEKLVTAEDRLSDAMAKAFLNDDGIQRWTAALEMAQDKTLAAKDSIENMIASLQTFVAEGGDMRDLEGIMEIITGKFESMGLAWGDSIGELDASRQMMLLTTHSLEDLARAGVLTEKKLTFGEKLKKSLESIGQLKTPRMFDSITKRVLAMGLSFLSARKLLQMFMNAAGRAPDSISKKFTALNETVSDLFAGATVAAMDKMTAGVDRLNAAFQSESGQKFARAMEIIGGVVGNVVAFAFDRLASAVEWAGDHVEPIIIALALATAVLAKNALMAAWAHREQAKAALLANLPMLAMIAAIGILTFALVKMGVTAEDIFGFIGGLVFGLYAAVYNNIANIWNTFAIFAEFLANLFIDPVTAIKNLFADLADMIYGVLSRIASAIDRIFGTSLADNLTGWKEEIDRYRAGIESNAIKIDRMENLDYAAAIANGTAKGKALGASLSDYALKNAQAQDIKDISRNTSAIKDAVTDEDITAMVDMAERQFVSQVNLTAQTPVITVNGANTGNTDADRQNLARAIRDILIDQLSSGPVSPSPAYYGG